MGSQSDLLINQLDRTNRILASFAHVITLATEKLTKGSITHDFVHSEAVHQRLSGLLPSAHLFGLSDADIFIFVASAYLHDIGHSESKDGRGHGELSAKMINNKESLKYLFPSGDIQNQVAKVCLYHDREIAELSGLEENVDLDIRPCCWIERSQMTAQPKFLAAIFRLADELECNSDRMLSQSTEGNDPRTHIAGVRLDLESRSICLDFKYGSIEESQNACKAHLSQICSVETL